MKHLKMTIVVIIAGALIVGYFYYLNVRNASNSQEEEAVQLTEVEDLLTTDLENKYPPTPREVIKLYNRIMKVCYNEELTDEEVEGLARLQWELLDPKLQEINPWEQFLQSKKSDIQLNHEMERRVVDMGVSDSSDIDYKDVDGEKCAVVTSSYFMSEGDSYEKSFQDYALLQNDSDWKIVAFQLSQEQASRSEE